MAPAAPVSAANTLHVTSCADSGATTLRGKIGSAAAGDTIVFDLNCTGATAITLTSGTLTLTKNVTIDGTGHTVVVDGGCAFNGTFCTAGGVTVFTVNGGVTASLTALTIQHGSATNGSCIANNNFGTLTVTNSTLSGNTVSSVLANSFGAGSFAGGIYSGIACGCTVHVTNSTLSGNDAGEYGGGIFNGNTLVVTNTIIAANTATINGPVVFNALVSGGHNLVGSTFGSGGTFASPLNPQLSPPGSYGGPTQTISLLMGASAIAHGDPTVCAAVPVSGVDQRGYPRQAGMCSIGAFEAQPVVSPLPPQRPPGPAGGPPSPLPVARPSGGEGRVSTEPAARPRP